MLGRFHSVSLLRGHRSQRSSLRRFGAACSRATVQAPAGQEMLEGRGWLDAGTPGRHGTHRGSDMRDARALTSD
jgi:hypothetical protein